MEESARIRMLDTDDVTAATPWAELVDALAAAAAANDVVSPDRHVHAYRGTADTHSSLLLMPAWTDVASDDGLVGVKVVTFVPDNGARKMPTINAAYLAFDRITGAPLAMLDGDTLTARRTAAISALAARLLARRNARHLLVIGTGQLVPAVVAAHAEVGGIERATVWGRNAARAAEAVHAAGQHTTVPVRAADDLAATVGDADLVVCVTGASSPVLRGAWLRPGTHVNLVGSFRPDMRESDDDVVRRATLFVDVPNAVEAGDLAQPMGDGVIVASDIAGDLSALAAGRHPGRATDEEITVFKSVGFAAADLTTARLALWR